MRRTKTIIWLFIIVVIAFFGVSFGIVQMVSDKPPLILIEKKITDDKLHE